MLQIQFQTFTTRSLEPEGRHQSTKPIMMEVTETGEKMIPTQSRTETALETSDVFQ